jgi:FkbM family methyltransferase
MRKHIKASIKTLISTVVVYARTTRVGRAIFRQILCNAMQATKKVVHNKVELFFAIPNRLNEFRVDTFSTKEPETLEWIDSIPSKSILWDIGANIGLYSCYAAKAKDCRVFSFEPSVFNLELLARNIHLNNLSDKVVIIPLPLSNNLALNTLKMTTTELGGALSTFGEDYGWDGLTLNSVFSFQTLGLTADDFVKLLGFEYPNYLKIDVDGIEHLVLSGGREVLEQVDSVLIEVNDNFFEQSVRCQKILSESGLVLKAKRHSEMFNPVDSFGGGVVWNQIWSRENNV